MVTLMFETMHVFQEHKMEKTIDELLDELFSLEDELNETEKDFI